MRYTVVLEQEEDGGYVVSVHALPGCVSQGDTRAEALNNIREAIDLYVEDCREVGDPVPTEAGKEFVEVEAALREAFPVPSSRSPLRKGRGSRPQTGPIRHSPPNHRRCRPHGRTIHRTGWTLITAASRPSRRIVSTFTPDWLESPIGKLVRPSWLHAPVIQKGLSL